MNLLWSVPVLLCLFIYVVSFTPNKFPTTPSSSYITKHRAVTTHPSCIAGSYESVYLGDYTDNYWVDQWYMHDYRTEDMPVMDLNVIPLHRKGIKGQGIFVGIVGQGASYIRHPDLKKENFKDYIYDGCGSEDEELGTFEFDIGTQAAGLIAMQENNEYCGVGVAPAVTIASIKWKCNWPPTFYESKHQVEAVKFKRNIIQIYFLNWSFEPFKQLTSDMAEAINGGVTSGRGGKGSIYVHAVGTKAYSSGSCVSDAFANNPHVISVTGATDTGKFLSYGQRCAAIFATAYAADGFSQNMYTTHPRTLCLFADKGTFTAGALATGIIALLLGMNNELTTRDMAHLIALGSEVAPVANQRKSWQKNAAGFWVSTEFGFGLMNAENMANYLENWKPVDDQISDVISLRTDRDENKFRSGVTKIFQINYEQSGRIQFLEHIIIKADISCFNPQVLKIYLTSPKGTVVELLKSFGKAGSYSKEACLKDWNIKSIHTWGEDPRGTWAVELLEEHSLTGFSLSTKYVEINKLEIHLFGMSKQPKYQLPRRYSGFWLRNFECSDPAEKEKALQIKSTMPIKADAHVLEKYSGVTVFPLADPLYYPSPYLGKYKDGLWNLQWYAHDYRLDTLAPVVDLRLVPVYDAGYTGKDVYIAMVGYGVDGTHPDLVDNYVEELSLDARKMSTGASPSSESDFITHLSAGIIAMKANNGKCGVGVAFDAKIAGLKLFDDKNLEKVVVHKHETFHIYNIDYSGSWGKSYNDTGAAISKNLKQQGKGGIGAIYVTNVGSNTDGSSSCAKYAIPNMEGMIVVGGATQSGKVASYTRHCPAVFAATFMTEEDDDQVVTTSTNGECTKDYGGTWSASAFATGMIALLLQANKYLSHRDVMHIIAYSTEVAPLADLKYVDFWKQNQKGFWFSNHFGFGLMNAENMIKLALDWKPVPSIKNYEFKHVNLTYFLHPTKYEVTEFEMSDTGINYLEDVDIYISHECYPMGFISMKLKSPEGTWQQLTYVEQGDKKWFMKNWKIRIVHFWGENPNGKWSFATEAGNDVERKNGLLLTLRLRGTEEMPNHYKQSRTYAPFRFADGRSSETKPK